MDISKIEDLFRNAKNVYDKGGSPLDEIGEITQYCIDQLRKNARTREQGTLDSRTYDVLYTGNNISRPIRRDLFELKTNFQKEWKSFVDRIGTSKYLTGEEQVKYDKLVYIAIISFSACYDIWKNASRKTPGTYFEVITGSLLSHFYKDVTRSKHVPIPGESESVTTDIVLESKKGKGVVFPVKITTRERIVQPFAHQRILFSVFGDKYRSVLVSVSEIQRAKNDGVNQICVPGTIRLFHKHLAKLSGMFYLDPPLRYMKSDISGLIPVMNYCSLFTGFVGESLT